jgi:hypothetical protein
VNLWPIDEPVSATSVATLGHDLVALGVVTGDVAAEVRNRNEFLPEQLLVVNLQTLEIVGGPTDVSKLDSEIYRAVPLPDGSILALHVDGSGSLISADGEISTELFQLDDVAVQMKAHKFGTTAAALYGNGGAVTIDLNTFEVSDLIVGLPGHRDVRFTADGRALLIQDGRSRTLLYDLRGEPRGRLHRRR